MIIIIRFGENNVLGPKYIDIYDVSISGVHGGVGLHGSPYIFLFIIHKN